MQSQTTLTPDFAGTWWWRMLVFATGFTVIFGLAMVYLPGPTQWYFNSLIFAQTDNPFDAGANRYIIFAFGIIGAVIVGWGVALMGIILKPLRQGERWAWWVLALSVNVWFVVDSVLSITSGYWQNAVSNLAFYVLFAVPLLPAYRALWR
jgi:hypothetical protein